METLRIRVHLIGGQSMETVTESTEEPEDYAAELAAKLDKGAKGFKTIENLIFHTSGVTGFDVDSYERKEQ